MDNVMVFKVSLITCLLGTARTAVPVMGPNLELASSSNPVYPKQRVTFTCVARGSSILAWSSTQYIGGGVLMEFVSIDTQGETITKTSMYNNETVATLTYKHVDGQTFVLASTLRIIASPLHSISNVSCINVDLDVRKDITLHVIGTPAQVMNSSLHNGYSCPGELIKFVCITHNSSILAWSSDDYIGSGKQLEMLSIDQTGASKASDINPTTIAVVDKLSMENGRINITSTLFISVPLDSGDSSHNRSIACINVDIGTRDTITFQVAGPDNCSNTTTAVLPATDGNLPSSNGSNLYVTTLISVILIVLLTLGVTGIVVIALKVITRRYHQSVRNSMWFQAIYDLYQEEQPPSDREEEQPPSDQEEEQPPSDQEEEQPPSDQEEEQPPSDREEEQPPSDQEEEQPPSDREEEQPPSDREEEQPPSDREEEQPQSNREEEQPPSDREEEQPPSDREEEQPPSNREREQPPSDQEGEQPPSDREGEHPPSNREGEQPPSDREGEQHPSNREGEQPLSDREREQPTSDQEKKQPLANEEEPFGVDKGEQPDQKGEGAPADSEMEHPQEASSLSGNH